MLDLCLFSSSILPFFQRLPQIAQFPGWNANKKVFKSSSACKLFWTFWTSPQTRNEPNQNRQSLGENTRRASLCVVLSASSFQLEAGQNYRESRRSSFERWLARFDSPFSMLTLCCLLIFANHSTITTTMVTTTTVMESWSLKREKPSLPFAYSLRARAWGKTGGVRLRWHRSRDEMQRFSNN